MIVFFKTIFIQEHILHANSNNNENYTGLLIASKHGFSDIVNLFIEHGADLNTTTKRHKYSALHFACKSGSIEV